MQRIPPKVPRCTQSPYHPITCEDIYQYCEDTILEEE